MDAAESAKENNYLHKINQGIRAALAEPKKVNPTHAPIPKQMTVACALPKEQKASQSKQKIALRKRPGCLGKVVLKLLLFKPLMKIVAQTFETFGIIIFLFGE